MVVPIQAHIRHRHVRRKDAIVQRLLNYALGQAALQAVISKRPLLVLSTEQAHQPSPIAEQQPVVDIVRLGHASHEIQVFDVMADTQWPLYKNDSRMRRLSTRQANEVAILCHQDTSLLSSDAKQFDVSDLAARNRGVLRGQHIYTTKSELRSNRSMDMLVKEIPKHAIDPIRPARRARRESSVPVATCPLRPAM